MRILILVVDIFNSKNQIDIVKRRKQHYVALIFKNSARIGCIYWYGTKLYGLTHPKTDLESLLAVASVERDEVDHL